MIRKYTLKVGETYTFSVGQTDNYLILRDASHSLVLESDSFKGVELTRSDTVIITDYQEMQLRFINQSAEPIYFEFQLSQVDIRIKEQRMSVAGGVVVDEIVNPVVVSEIQQPVNIANFPEETKASKSMNSRAYNISGTTWVAIAQPIKNRKSILIQPNIDILVGSKPDVSINGLKVLAGGTMELETAASIYACGVESGKTGEIRTLEEYF
jgi:hypothetical protein